MSELQIKRGLRINFNPTEDEELAQNVRTILNIPRGEVPLYREFGIDASFIDSPDLVAEARFTGAAFEALDTFEPRIEATNLDFDRETSADDRAQGVYFPVLTYTRAESEDDI